jgi:hypothetical protein
MNTGTDAEQPGVYVSQCCDYETTFSEGQTFTRCPKCSALTTWEIGEGEMDFRMAA